MESYWQQCHEVAMSLMSAVELGLSIPQGTLATRCLPSASEVRLNHYPAISSKELASGLTARIWPHTDFGIITLLLTDSVGGLEIEDPSSPGTFLPVPQGARNEMIVNVADTLQRWTNGVLKAGLHRVMLPSGSKGDEDEMVAERWSIPYLFKAKRETKVGALQEFVGEGQKSAYDNITALEFQLRRQHQVYSAEQVVA
jgi:isopenicillin N synthase-like dioxygenase